MSNDMNKAAARLLKRLAAYRSPDDWPQPMREAIAELEAEISPPERIDPKAAAKLRQDTPAHKFPVLWNGGGDDDELSDLVEKIVNKNICLYLSELAADKFGAVAGFDDGCATLTFLLDEDGFYMKTVEVEEAFLRHDKNFSYESHEYRTLADTFQRLADLFRAKVED